jgi:hypothetical protein
MFSRFFSGDREEVKARWRSRVWKFWPPLGSEREKKLLSSVGATLCGRPYSNKGARLRAATQGRPYNQIDFFSRSRAGGAKISH